MLSSILVSLIEYAWMWTSAILDTELVDSSPPNPTVTLIGHCPRRVQLTDSVKVKMGPKMGPRRATHGRHQGNSQVGVYLGRTRVRFRCHVAVLGIIEQCLKARPSQVSPEYSEVAPSPQQTHM